MSESTKWIHYTPARIAKSKRQVPWPVGKTFDHQLVELPKDTTTLESSLIDYLQTEQFNTLQKCNSNNEWRTISSLMTRKLKFYDVNSC